MPDISVPWGQGELNVSLPPQWRLRQVAQPELRAAPADWADYLARALSQGVGDLSLSRLLAARRGGRITIIVEDVTRHSPLHEILPIVLREVRHAGVEDEQLEIVFANGMHPPMTAEQAAAKLGDSCPGIAWRCNRYDDARAYVSLGRAAGMEMKVDRGVADADLRIIVSSVSPHLQAGFGGGYKMVFPGCAHIETIRTLHRLGLGGRPRQFVGTDAEVNAMRLAIDAGGRLLDERHGTSYAVQYLLDGNNLPTSVGAGEVLGTNRMMAKHCAAASGVVLEEPGDVLIVNAHPRDFDLWQSFKCIANTRWAARPNGAIICLTRCEGGVNGMNVPRWWRLSPTWTRRLVRSAGPDALGSMVSRLVPSLAGDAAFFIRMAMQTIHRNPIYMVSPKLCDMGAPFPGLHIFAGVDEAVAAAQKHLGKGDHRVVVFPAGGTTFPVPPRAIARA